MRHCRKLAALALAAGLASLASAQDFTGGGVYGRYPASINLNLTGGGYPVGSLEIGIGLFPANGSEWVNLSGGSGSQPLTDSSSGVSLGTVTYSAPSLGHQNATDTFLQGYLGGNETTGVSITVDGLPYEMYDVIVYLAGATEDDFPAVCVNGNYYAWKTESYTGNLSGGEHTYSTSATMNVSATETFGAPAATAALGTNAIRVKALTGQTLTVKGQPTWVGQDGKEYRGTVAAIQIVNRVRFAVDTVTTWKLSSAASIAPCRSTLTSAQRGN